MPDDHVSSPTVRRIRLASLKGNADENLLEYMTTPMALLSPQTLKEWEREKKSARVHSVKGLDCE